MEGNRYQIIFVVVLLSFNILGVVSEGEESNDEARPTYDYIQIFKSIPALFEYLLDALEERPEILEKNDVTTFKRNIDVGETEESENSDNEKKIDKRNADCDTTKVQDENGDTNKINKRDTSSTQDVIETTVAYEYGNSNVVMKDLDEIEEEDRGVKRESLKREDRIRRKRRSVLSKLDDDIDDFYRSFGEMFFGFEHLFGLDLKPEEIEERILNTEKLLEEYNNKKEER